MREINLEELKKIELRLLKQFKDICEKEGFRYSLAGGTLLGAVRHKGFIPWDDDIDISLPRKDYNNFINYCKTHTTPFKLISHELESSYWYLFAKITAPDTIIYESNNNPNELPMGVYIDIFPLDGLADNLFLAKLKFYQSSLYRELLVAKNWKRFFISKTHSLIVEPIRFILYLLSRKLSAKRLIHSIEKIYKGINFDCVKYSTCICGVYRSKEIHETLLYNNFVSLKFEGITCKCFKEYEKYLTLHYGDYKKLPPLDKRESHHMFKAYYLDEENV